MEKLKEIYKRLTTKTDAINVGPSYQEVIEAIEEEHPEYRLIPLTIEQRAMLECLKTAFRNFNNKWRNPGDGDLSWAYFTPDGYHFLSVEDVYYFFEKLCLEKMDREREEVEKLK